MHIVFIYLIVKGINLYSDTCYKVICGHTSKFPNLFLSIVLACLGFLSPANRGALMTCAVVLWVLLGTPAGYVSARMYKSKYMHLFNVTQQVKFRIAGLNYKTQTEADVSDNKSASCCCTAEQLEKALNLKLFLLFPLSI